MARYLSRIFEYLNKQLPTHSQSNIVPRNLVFIKDRFLKGSARFARKFSNDVAVLVPHNQVQLADRIQANATGFELDADIPEISPGDIVRVDKRERFRVLAFDHTSLTGTFTTASEIEHETGAYFDLYATPIEFNTLSGPPPTWDTNPTIVVTSPYPIYAGDVLGLPEPTAIDNPYALFETKVLSQTTTGPVLGVYTVTLTLDMLYKDWSERGYSSGDTLYLRCYPAYRSLPVALPKWFNGEHIGPVLLDWFSGILVDTDVEDAQFNIDVLDPIFSVLYSVNNVGKNYVIWEAPVHNSVPVFWRSWEADVNYRNGYTVVKAQANGHAQLSTELVPVMRPGTKWILNLKAQGATTFRYKFHPNPWKETSIAASTDAYVPVEITATEQESPRLQIAFRFDDSDTDEIWMGDWQESPYTVENIQYEIVGRVVGGFCWASSGLEVKPYFKNALQLQVRLNSGHKLNSGYFLGGS